MRTILAATGLAVVHPLPTGVVARPDRSEKNAAKECAAERREMGRDAFAEQYGTNKNGRNAFGKCVSRKGQGV
jgi:hypothetical protein